MFTKKTFVKAASIAQRWHIAALDAKTSGDVEAEAGHGVVAYSVQEAFIALFRDDNPRFDADRFREACKPLPASKARRVGA